MINKNLNFNINFLIVQYQDFNKTTYMINQDQDIIKEIVIKNKKIHIILRKTFNLVNKKKDLMYMIININQIFTYHIKVL